jgi:hypothetical protein
LQESFRETCKAARLQMPLHEELERLLSSIDETTRAISFNLEFEILSNENRQKVIDAYSIRHDSIKSLIELFRGSQIPEEEKTVIKEFIDEIVKMDKKNLKIIDKKLKDIKEKLKLLLNGKNLKVYSKWS